mgnify:CR=1 FL=1|tara:strand:+ start:11200 stop:13179 length:1980 start_codon:yes stop_codon:yes gene_type:complete
MSSILMKRVTRDLRDFFKNPPPGISVEPDPDNIFEWHFTIIAPEGSPVEKHAFHGCLEFGENYPMEPPYIGFLSTVIPNEESSFRKDDKGRYIICMSISNNIFYSDYHDSRYKKGKDGWSSGNTPAGILVVLQTDLFGKTPSRLSTKSSVIKEIILRSKKYKCYKCQHDGSDMKLYGPKIINPLIFPEKTIPENQAEAEANEEEANEEEDEESEDEDYIEDEDSEDEKESEDIDFDLDDKIKEKKDNKFIIDALKSVNNEDKFDLGNPICYTCQNCLVDNDEKTYGIPINFKLKNLNNLSITLYPGQFTDYNCVKKFRQLFNDNDNKLEYLTAEKNICNVFLPLYFNKEHWDKINQEIFTNISNLLSEMLKTTIPLSLKRCLYQHIKEFQIKLDYEKNKNEVILLGIWFTNGVLLIYDNKINDNFIINFYYLLHTTINIINNNNQIMEMMIDIKNKFIQCHTMKLLMPDKTFIDYGSILFCLWKLMNAKEKYKFMIGFFREIIRHNSDCYKSKKPEVLDFSGSTKNKSKLVFESVGVMHKFVRIVKICYYLWDEIKFDFNSHLSEKQFQQFSNIIKENDLSMKPSEFWQFLIDKSGIDANKEKIKVPNIDQYDYFINKALRAKIIDPSEYFGKNRKNLKRIQKRNKKKIKIKQKVEKSI